MVVNHVPRHNHAIIYGLRIPGGKCRYVGSTVTSFDAVLTRHMAGAKSGKKKQDFAAWLLHNEIEVYQLEWVPIEVRFQQEGFWQQELADCNLFNDTKNSGRYAHREKGEAYRSGLNRYEQGPEDPPWLKQKKTKEFTKWLMSQISQDWRP